LPADRRRVRELVRSAGVFSPEEQDIAVELVNERLVRGEASGYEFLLAEADGVLAGYACFGRIPGTASSFDLYWIVVDPSFRRSGVAARLLAGTEGVCAESGATRIYADTSTRSDYGAARAFYESSGYRREAVLPDFYRPGDGKAIYVKVLPQERRGG
jgi:ribosomal protein S18 acetylase RimI-like enzyme